MQFFENIRNLHVTVMGLGLNGGGLASADFFARHGAQVTVTDLKNAETLAPSVNKLKHFPNIRFVLGEHRIEDFKTADVVIKNPGVKREGNIYLEEAKHIETDISVFLSLSKAPLIAVTGSKGKSSTASAIYYGLQAFGYTSFRRQYHRQSAHLCRKNGSGHPCCTGTFKLAACRFKVGQIF